MSHQESRRRLRLPGVAMSVAPLLVCFVAMSAMAPGIARADRVNDLISQLRSGGDYKVRLSAAVSLTRIGDARGVPALVAALSDGDKNVRAAAAVGLGSLVQAKTKADLRTQAIAALERTAQKDSAELVRNKAKEALTTLRGAGGSTPAGPMGTIFVDVGPMGSKPADNAQKMKDLMRKTASKAMTRANKDIMITWPGGKVPTKAELSKKGVAGYHVDGTLTEMTVKERGASAVVSCKISMLIATHPEKSMFGFLNGGASVEASSSASDVALAREDCVVAVVEDLVRKKVVPTLESRGGR